MLTAQAVQRLVFNLRAAVEDKLHRLPSSHFHEQARGDVLSRATNDVDNISQALNQLLTQLIMSVLMLCGSLAMMLWISPLLAAIALVSVPAVHADNRLHGPPVPGLFRRPMVIHR